MEKVCFDEKGLFHHSQESGITIIIPKGAVMGHASLQLGATELLVDFRCEDEFEPVSPFVWVHTDAVLLKPVELYMPHYIDVENSENSQIVLLTRGHEKDAVFKAKSDAKIEILKTICCIRMSHFCVICLAAAKQGNPPKRRYHVVSVEKKIANNPNKEVHLCLLYTLECLKV